MKSRYSTSERQQDLNILPEAMKAAQEVSMEVFHPFSEKILNEEEVPSNWKEGFIVKLYSIGLYWAELRQQ